MLVPDLDGNQTAAVRRHLDAQLAERSAGGEAAVLTPAINIGVGTC